MRRWTLLISLLVCLYAPFLVSPVMVVRASGTYTAASCSRADVDAVINGPTHTAVDGDVIQIPPGMCSWANGILIPINIGVTIIGNGSPASTPSTRVPDASCTATQIIDNDTGGANQSLFTFTPTIGNSLTRLSCIKFSQTGLSQNAIRTPVLFGGTCSSMAPYCPNLRVDNVTFDGSLVGIPNPSFALMAVDNVYGVMDHNTISGGSDLATLGWWAEFVNFNNSAWHGVGLWGDNSWTSADSFGTAENLYIENNSFAVQSIIVETEAPGPNNGEGGGRAVVRFNDCSGCIAGIAAHGTESNGRARGLRQTESYGNNWNCVQLTTGCVGGLALRSGTGIEFSNTLTIASGAAYDVSWAGGVYSPTINTAGTHYAIAVTLRIAGNDIRIGGATPANDLALTVSSVDGSGAVTGVTAVGTAPAGTGSFSNAGTGHSFWNSYVALNVGRIGQAFTPWGVCDGAGAYDHNDGIVYYTGAMASVMMSGSTTTFADSMGQTFGSSSSLIPNGAPYAAHDASLTNVGAFISANTSTTISALNTGTGGGTAPPAFVNGDTYQVLRASACLDQSGRSGGTLFNLDANPMHSPMPTNASGGWVYQTLDPLYEWNDSGYNPVSGQLYNKNVVPGPNNLNAPQLIENRDWYSDNSQGTPVAQTSSSSPFDGTVGVGFGTKARRPSTCTTGVGYYATNEGSWNTSGNGFGSGNLYICVANAWPGSPSYTPYAYPHPLVGNSQSFSSQPMNTVTGIAFSPAITVTVSPAAADSITLSVTSGTCTFTGTDTQTSDSMTGVATFSLTAGTVGTSCALTAHNNTDGTITDVMSSLFNVTSSCVPNHLTFTGQPSDALVGGSLGTVQVAIKDAGGVTCTSNTSTVTLSAHAGSTAASPTSSSNLSKAAVAGVATWTDLSVTPTAGSISLDANDGMLTVGTSSTINISAPVSNPGNRGAIIFRHP